MHIAVFHALLTSTAPPPASHLLASAVLSDQVVTFMGKYGKVACIGITMKVKLTSERKLEERFSSPK